MTTSVYIIRDGYFETFISSSNGHKANVPKLRFPEFEGEYTTNLLGSIFEKITKKNTENKIRNVICNSAKNGLLPQREYFDKDIANANNTNGYYIIQKDDFVYNPRKSNEAPYGPVSVYKYIDDGIVSPLYLCFRSLCKIEIKYYEWYFKSSSWHRYVYMSGDSGARHDRVSMRDEVFFNMPLTIPTFDEQRKIAAVLTLVEQRIEKQRQLVEALKLYKRGVLQQIYNQKLRLTTTISKWEKKHISDIFRERCERADGNEELLAVTINNGIQKRAEIELKDNSSDDKHNYKKVYIGDIAYNTMRMWQGASGASCYNGIVSPAYTVIYPHNLEKQNIVFWCYYFKDAELIKTFQKYSQGLTSDTWNLKFPQLAAISVCEPCYNEQCKIADFTTNYEKKISTEEECLNNLQKQKSYLLQQMFI